MGGKVLFRCDVLCKWAGILEEAQLPKNEENVLEMQPIENADVNATDDEIQVDYLEKTEEENSESSSENEDYP